MSNHGVGGLKKVVNVSRFLHMEKSGLSKSVVLGCTGSISG